MSIQNTFQSPNSPLNELMNLIAYNHPNLLSKKIRFLEPDSKQLISTGLPISREDLYFALDREIKLSVSPILIKKVTGSEQNTIKLTTYVKVTMFTGQLVLGLDPVNGPKKRPLVFKIHMITSVPSCFQTYARGQEIVSISSTDNGSNISLNLKYKLMKSEEEGILASFGFSVASITNNLLETLKDIIVNQYSVKRKEHFCQQSVYNITSISDLEKALSSFV